MKRTTTPIADRISKKLEIHQDIRIDDYYWMRLSDDEKDSEKLSSRAKKVFDYLERENEFYKKETRHTLDFQNSLFEEMKNRIKEDDSSVPYFENGYYYITRYEVGDQYPIYTRKKASLDAEEEIILDVNFLAEGKDYFDVKGLSISLNNQFLIYGVDELGRRQYTLFFKNLIKGNLEDDTIQCTSGSTVWANDDKMIFYTKKDPTTLRTDKVYRHRLGTSPDRDMLIFEEKDEAYFVFISKTKSKKYLMIGSSSTLQTEYWYLDAQNPSGDFKLFQPREKNLEYSITHFNDAFYILTNKDEAVNFKLMKTSEDATSKEHWQEIVPHREDVLLEDITIFEKYWVLEERKQGLNQIRILSWDGSEDYYLPFDEEIYCAYVYINPQFDSLILRYSYNSMTTPASIIDFNMETRERKIKKEQEVLTCDFDRKNYKSDRIWVKSKKGEEIPMSIVYRKETPLSENTPILMYGYGSYGYVDDDSFSISRLSLLDRGFAFVLVHMRGSSYLGRAWYDGGKLLNKKNTFEDFIACAKYLIENKMTSSDHLYAMGGSAGGLLMGAISNSNPELFNGIILQVPFLDVLTTMLDDSIPLTTGEYDEWGNPNEKEYYDYIKSYSPYDNIEKKSYPNMLITTGLHDSQVQYWESAKYVAKLRALKTDDKKLYLHTDMNVGHGGASGRFDSLKEVAIEYAFLMDLEKMI